MAAFDGIVGTIVVNKNILMVDSQDVGGMYSANLKYRVEFTDDFWDGFDVLEWYAGNSLITPSELCKYDLETKILTIPYGGFIKDGNLYVTARGIKDDIKYASNILVLNVGQNINIEDNDVVADPSWMDKVTQIIDNIFITKYDPQYEALVTKVDEQIDENARLITKANEQQQQIDNAIDVMGDYEIVNEDPTQIRFKKGNGEFGDTVDLGDGLASKNMVNAGYTVQKGKTYSGPASDYGIYVAEIEGAYEQDTTNGFQLFDQSKISNATSGGVTLTNNGDGGFTISGTGVTTQTFSKSYQIKHEEFVKLFKQGTFTIKVDKVVNPHLYINLYNESGFVKTLAELYNKTEQQNEILQEYIDNEGYYLMLGFISNSNAGIVSGTIKPMLYQDGDGTWEKFTGGEPAPNPNYPQEPRFNKIRKFISSGKNIVDQFNLSKYNPIQNQGYKAYKITGLIPNQQYTMSSNVPKTDTATLYFYGTITTQNGVFLNEPKTFSSDENGNMNFFVRTDNTSGYNLADFENGTYYIMLNLGDTAEQYEPFRGLIETPTYHNLFNISGELNQTKDGSTSGANLNTLEGNVLVAGANSSTVDCQGQKLVNDLTGKTISVGVNITSLGTGIKGKVMIYDNGELGYGFEQGLGYYSIDGYTCKSDNIVIAFGTVGGEKAKFEDIIVNIGEEAEEWVPYVYTDKPQGVLELRALPDGTRDKHVMTFEEMGMNLLSIGMYEVKTIDQITTLNNGLKGAVINISDKAKMYDQASYIVSNLTKTLGTNQVTENTIYQNRDNFVIVGNSEDTLETLKRFIGTKIWYKLAMQDSEEYNLYMIPSFYDYTNVWTDSDVEPNMIEWHANTYAGRNQELGNDLIRIEDVSAFKDAVSVGNTTNRTVLKTVDNDGIYMYNESKGLQQLAIKSETAEIARIAISQDLEYTEENEGNINLIFEEAYPDGYNAENCMVVGVSELDYATGKRTVATFTTVELDAKQVIRIYYNTTIGGPKTVQLDVVLMKLPSIL